MADAGACSLCSRRPVVASCGFQLRGSANFAFSSIHVGAPPALPFTQELKRTIAEAGKAQVLDTPQGARS